MAITIPNKHYVTIQYRKDASTESGLLGFASPYTKDAAFEKRHRTQDAWAYGGYDTQFDIGEDGSILPNANAKIDRFTLFTTKCYPILTDNVPLEGFEVAKSVRRSGWSGSGNVVWRVADPRGFELEISSDNFARVIDCTTIENGKILGKCLWGRDGGKNILLPELSEPYQEAVKLTVKTNTKISLKDVQIGDTVEILSTKVPAADLVCQYLGKYFFLDVTQLDNPGNRYGNYSGKFKFNQAQTEKYLLKSEKTGTYFVLSTPKVVSIVKKIAVPLLKEDVAKEVTSKIGRIFKITDAETTTVVSPTKIDMSKVTVALVPLKEKWIGEKWPQSDKYSSQVDSIVCKLDGKYWMTSLTSGPGSSYNNYVSALVEMTIDLVGCGFDLKKVQQVNSNRWGYGSQTYLENVVRKDFHIPDLEQFRFEVTANGITGGVYRLGYF